MVDNTIKIAPDVKLGSNVEIYGFVNLYGCKIGDETKIGTFVEVQKNVLIGKRCKIQSHTFICEGVTIEDEVMIAMCLEMELKQAGYEVCQRVATGEEAVIIAQRTSPDRLSFSVRSI